MKSVLITLFFLFSAISAGRTGPDINFRPGPLLKELKDLGCPGNIILREAVLPVSDEGFKSIKGKFFTAGCGENRSFSIYIGRVNSCRAGGCSATVEDDALTDYEFFDYYILFDSRNSIISVRVINYEATHGQEITVKGWLRQFAGYDGSGLLRVGKEVDSISGATVSVYSIVNDIRQKTDLLRKLNSASGSQDIKIH